MKDLLEDYRRKKPQIKKRLEDFSRICEGSDKALFRELCFCILTPQAKAVKCDEAVSKLERKNLLFSGSKEDIRRCLGGVRFPNNKAQYLVEARQYMDLKKRIDRQDLIKTRDWLVKNIKGLGYKEASHFLRNIGLGKDLAILDRHILKNLRRCGIIKKVPDLLSRSNYLKVENSMRRFFKKLNIPIEEADLLFWSSETGYIFK